MNKKIKSKIIAGSISGIVTATCMAGFDYFDGELFNLNKFISLALVNGIIVSLIVKVDNSKEHWWQKTHEQRLK